MTSGRAIFMRSIRTLSVLLCPFVADPTAAQTVPVGEEGPLADILAPVPGRKACFTRTYEAAHLDRHPQQRVTSLAFGLRYHRHPPDKQNPDGQRNYYFTLVATMKGERKRLVASGECAAHAGAIGCISDCDGGGVGLSRSGDSSLRLDLTRYGRLRMTRGCGDEETDAIELKPGKDDKNFRLDPASTDACRF